MTPSIEERRRVSDKLAELVTSTNVNWPQLFDALGTPGRDVTVLYLADLIDPFAWKVTVAGNERLLDRCRTPVSRRLWQRGLSDENPVLASTSDQVRADATYPAVRSMRS